MIRISRFNRVAVNREHERNVALAGDRPTSSLPLRFRPIEVSDLQEIMVIEEAAFSYPWTRQFFLEELRAACGRSRAAILGEQIVGYVIFWLVAGDVDIHNLAVAPPFRRRGIGRALLSETIAEAKQAGSRHVTLEVRRSNTEARRLYESLGFVVKGVRRGYYSDNGEDATMMALELR
jgi:ribosomal-protein-alanine N-acetyltransferase